jgi:ABC-type multidrug transport system fused ATPase/permease subunit
MAISASVLNSAFYRYRQTGERINDSQLKKIIQHIFIVLTAQESKKWWWLVMADIAVSLLDIVFLVALVFVINWFTGAVTPKAIRYAWIFNNQVASISLFFLLFTLKNLFAFSIIKQQFRFVYAVASRLSAAHLKLFLWGSYSHYVQIDSSVSNRHISQLPIEFGHYVVHGVLQLISQMVLVAITITVVLFFNPVLFPLLLLILLPPVLMIVVLLKQKMRAAQQHGKQTGEKTLQHLQEALASFVESNMYQKNDFFTGRYHRMQLQLNQYLSDRLVIQGLPPRLMEIFSVLGLLVLVIVHQFVAPNNSLQPVTIGALMIAAYKIIPGIVKITNINAQVRSYAAAAESLAATAGMQVPVIPPSLPPIDRIRFENIDFCYPGKPIFHHFSFALQKGDFAVIEAVSGKGKTTLANIITGFLQPCAGQMYINDQLLTNTGLLHYRQRINYVKQQPFFMHASITENISLGETIPNREKLRQVSALTGTDSIADKLLHGLDSVVTENGKNFSGGQQQRISFARALYRDCDLMVLDEPFNELDTASENRLLEHLRSLAANGKIILLITHNSAALSFCNKKIVLHA